MQVTLVYSTFVPRLKAILKLTRNFKLSNCEILFSLEFAKHTIEFTSVQENSLSNVLQLILYMPIIVLKALF